MANSTSTMHKIHAKSFALEDFSCDHMDEETRHQMESIIAFLETLRQKYLEGKDKQYWYDMIQLLPSSYNQKRTVQLNYQVLKSMYHARKNHRLDEWVEFTDFVSTLPYAKELICID